MELLNRLEGEEGESSLLRRDPVLDIIPQEEPLNEQEIMLAQRVAMGYKVKDIANLLNRSEAWVRSKKKDTRIVKLINDLQSEALDQAKRAINHTTLAAALKIKDLMDSSLDERVQLAAAKYILDIGIPKSDGAQAGNVINNFNFTNMTPEELKINILQRVKNLEMDD